jgi:hypothetical protein
MEGQRERRVAGGEWGLAKGEVVGGREVKLRRASRVTAVRGSKRRGEGLVRGMRARAW